MRGLSRITEISGEGRTAVLKKEPFAENTSPKQTLEIILYKKIKIQ
jgi:hypothetical protein